MVGRSSLIGAPRPSATTTSHLILTIEDALPNIHLCRFPSSQRRQRHANPPRPPTRHRPRGLRHPLLPPPRRQPPTRPMPAPTAPRPRWPPSPRSTRPMPSRRSSPPRLATGLDPVVIAADAYAKHCFRLAAAPGAAPEAAHGCRAQAASMMRLMQGGLRALERRQAAREKALSALQPAAMERAGYWFRESIVPDPAPSPARGRTARAGRPPGPAPLRGPHRGRAVRHHLPRPRHPHPRARRPAGALRLRPARARARRRPRQRRQPHPAGARPAGARRGDGVMPARTRVHPRSRFSSAETTSRAAKL